MSPTHTNSTHVSPGPAPRSATSRVAAVGARRDERVKKTGTSMVRYEARTTIDRPIGDVFARVAGAGDAARVHMSAAHPNPGGVDPRELDDQVEEMYDRGLVPEEPRAAAPYAGPPATRRFAPAP